MVAIIVFRLVLEAGYLYYVNPFFAYSGFIFDFSFSKYSESWLLFLFLIWLAPKELKRPSDFFILTLFLGLLVPLLSLYAFANQSRFTVYVVLFGYLLVNFSRNGRPILLPRIRYALFFSLGIAFAGALSVTLWFFFSGGVANFNLDLTKVYEFRRATGALIHVGPMGYINTWATNVFGPFLLAYGLLRKNYILVMIAVVLHVFWFGVTAHRAPLFYPIMIFFLWFYFRKTKALSFLPLGYSAIGSTALFCYFLFDYGSPASLFIRRFFFVISQLTFDYYSFFGANEFVFWSNSITSGILSYPYDLPPQALVGQWRGSGGWANNNFLSTGYMHAGIAGIIIYGIFVGLLFRLIDSLVSKKLPIWFIVAIVAIPIMSLLLSADLPTALLTHGIAVALILAFFARSGGTLRVFQR